MTDTPKTIEDLTRPITGWWMTADEETYTGGPLGTREDAMLEAAEAEAWAIARCTQKIIRVSDLFDADDFLGRANESLEEWTNEDGDPILDFTPSIVADLQANVRAAIDAWQVRHQLAPAAFMFAMTEDFERMPGEDT